MSKLGDAQSIVFSVLDVTAALLALMGLLPMAGGLPSISSPVVPFADTLWFVANLAGPALLLAAWLRPAFRGIPMLLYVLGYTLLLAVTGGLRLWATGFHRLAYGWLIMACCVGTLLLLMRRFWLWAVVGAFWSGLLLSVWVFVGVVTYTSANATLFPTLLVIQIVGAVVALGGGLLHLRHRGRLQPEARVAQP